MVSDAYARAKAGGPHEGLLRTYRDKPASMINKAIGSLVKKIAIHEQIMSKRLPIPMPS